MIIPVLVGRLGNQCFQIAHAISLAKDNGQEVHIPAQSSNERLWPATFKHLTNKDYSRFRETIKINEPSHDYTPIEWDNNWNDKNILLNGYWQSEKYFERNIDLVRAKLDVPYFRQSGFVGIHVRRGDYLQLGDKHPAQPYAYYRDAVAYFVEHNYKSFVVCSDDIAWCKEKFTHLKKEIPGIEFTYVEGNSALHDMGLLSSCDHLIMANSSFSLFAFIMNQYADKFCIAPAQWYGSKNAHLISEDLYPKNCIKL